MALRRSAEACAVRPCSATSASITARFSGATLAMMMFRLVVSGFRHHGSRRCGAGPCRSRHAGRVTWRQVETGLRPARQWPRPLRWPATHSLTTAEAALGRPRGRARRRIAFVQAHTIRRGAGECVHRHAEIPLRRAKLRLHRRKRSRGPGADFKGVKIPPSGAIGNEDDDFIAVGRPFGLEHRFRQAASDGHIGFELRCAERKFISLNMRQYSDFPGPPQTVPSSRENNFLCEVGSWVSTGGELRTIQE
jgi:hypothetical protein